MKVSTAGSGRANPDEGARSTEIQGHDRKGTPVNRNAQAVQIQRERCTNIKQKKQEERKIRVDVARWRWSYWRDLRRRLGETRRYETATIIEHR